MFTSTHITNLQASIALATAAGITPAQMVALLDVAIANAISARKLVVSYSADGRQLECSLDQAQRMRTYYAEQVQAAVSPLVVLSADMP